MMLLIYYLLIIFMIAMIIMMIPILMAMQTNKLSDKMSMFECGMSLNSLARKPFSLRFFLLMVLFIIFDIEIALLLVIPIMTPWSLPMILFLNMILITLTLGTLYEWSESSLNWKL